MVTSNNIIVVKVGDVLGITYNGGHASLMKYSKNLITGQEVSLLKMEKAVKTNILCDESDQYTHDMFNTINGEVINSNMILFTELEKML